MLNLILLACFSRALDRGNKHDQLDALWRLQIGPALIPALVTLYPRLTMPEGKKYPESRELNSSPHPNSVNFARSRTTVNSRHTRGKSTDVELIPFNGHGPQEEIDAARAEIEAQGKSARFGVSLSYFRER